MRVTDPGHCSGSVSDERRWGASVCDDLALQFAKILWNICTWMLSLIKKKKKDLHVSHMKIKGIETKSDLCKFHLKNSILLH